MEFNCFSDVLFYALLPMLDKRSIVNLSMTCRDLRNAMNKKILGEFSVIDLIRLEFDDFTEAAQFILAQIGDVYYTTSRNFALHILCKITYPGLRDNNDVENIKDAMSIGYLAFIDAICRAEADFDGLKKAVGSEYIIIEPKISDYLIRYHWNELAEYAARTPLSNCELFWQKWLYTSFEQIIVQHSDSERGQNVHWALENNYGRVDFLAEMLDFIRKGSDYSASLLIEPFEAIVSHYNQQNGSQGRLELWPESQFENDFNNAEDKGVKIAMLAAVVKAVPNYVKAYMIEDVARNNGADSAIIFNIIQHNPALINDVDFLAKIAEYSFVGELDIMSVYYDNRAREMCQRYDDKGISRAKLHAQIVKDLDIAEKVDYRLIKLILCTKSFDYEMADIILLIARRRGELKKCRDIAVDLYGTCCEPVQYFIGKVSELALE